MLRKERKGYLLGITNVIPVENKFSTVMAKRKTNLQKEEDMYWSHCVGVFFEFYKQNFLGEKPTFDGSAPRDLKNIVTAMKKRAEEKGVAWTKELAEKMLIKFLEVAISEPWIKDNFMPHILNRKKDSIFVKITQSQNNGQSFNSAGGGTQGRVDALRNW
jgi:hypothetical protein